MISLYHCQKMLLKTETPIQDNGMDLLDFNCERTGLHFRLDPEQNRTQDYKAASLCRMCEESCQPLKEHRLS